MFVLHDQLKKDTISVGHFKLCMVLMHNDANYPWLILVPKRSNVREIHHLADDDQLQLIRESSHLSEVMTSIFSPTTMNIAALGNVVPQLHVHHVARFEGDLAWPGPVWGVHTAGEYDAEVLAQRLYRLHSTLVGEGFQAYGADDGGGESESFTP
ncbi:MAG: diadenosine tetraphosphate (Ap4A) HIT family hydrolase [Lentisphaeria bacterium]|jgi:diadenosine tetraphosphate (Ap4A) HIT family hydrolase